MKHDIESYVITIKRKDADAKYSTCGHPAPTPQAHSTAQRTPAPASVHIAVAQAPAHPAAVTAPLPGILIDLKVKPGDSVTEGRELAVIEAMKMENSILAPRSGLIRSISASVGDSVSEGTVLLTID